MYRHILIPTDGSDLSRKAIQHGIALAKSEGAKVLGVAVTVPFHVFAINPDTLTDTPGSYQKRVAAEAARYLGQIKDAATAAGVGAATAAGCGARREAWRCLRQPTSDKPAWSSKKSPTDRHMHPP